MGYRVCGECGIPEINAVKGVGENQQYRDNRYNQNGNGKPWALFYVAKVHNEKQQHRRNKGGAQILYAASLQKFEVIEGQVLQQKTQGIDTGKEHKQRKKAQMFYFALENRHGQVSQ
jgi:hypothetical protein